MTNIIQELFGINDLTVLHKVDEVFEYMYSDKVQNKVTREYRRYRSYYMNKRHVRIENLHIQEAIDYYESLQDKTSEDYSEKISLLKAQLKPLTR